jgi:signal transduction histidine kinase
LKNLISNAVKYSPDGGLIRIIGEKIDNYYQVSVEDQGIGMTPEETEKIFDKFYRANPSDTSTWGTGLGMTIVENIVKAHGGDIWVDSNFGKGTTVSFKIPIT